MFTGLSMSDPTINHDRPWAKPSLFEINGTGIVNRVYMPFSPSGAVLLKTLPQILVTNVYKKKECKNEGVFAVIF